MKKIENNKDLKTFKLINQNGVECFLSNYGARILGIRVPLSTGKCFINR